MNKTPQLVVLLIAASAPGYAAVIDYHCSASLGVFVGNTPGTTPSTHSVPCNLSVGISASGAIRAIRTEPPEGGFSGGIHTTYAPNFNESASGFSFDLSHSGNASLSVISGRRFPTGPYSTVGAGLAEFGSAFESFSVDSPYTFELDYSFVEATSPTGSASGGASLSFSNNFLGDFSGGNVAFDRTVTGRVTGSLVPGQTYVLRSQFDAQLTGWASDGQEERYTASWSGSYARLTAVAVPVPGTALLILGGLALLIPFRLRKALPTV